MIRSGISMAKPHIRAGLHKGVEWMENKAYDKLGLNGQGFLGDAAKWLGHHAVDGVVGAMGGAVKPRKSRTKAQAGGGWLGDGAKWLGHHAVDGVVGAMGGAVAVKPRMDTRFLGHNAIMGGAAKPRKSRAKAQAGVGFLSDALGAIGLGVQPQAGGGWIGDGAKWIGHHAVDGIVGAMGGAVNPLRNYNEGMNAALFQRRIQAPVGRGLYQ
jgi:hypothetical protein